MPASIQYRIRPDGAEKALRKEPTPGIDVIAFMCVKFKWRTFCPRAIFQTDRELNVKDVFFKVQIESQNVRFSDHIGDLFRNVQRRALYPENR
jgi:hypothetical protein